MPGIIDRHTGEILSMPQLPEEAKQQIAAAVVRAYLRNHPEILADAAAQAGTAQAKQA